MEGRRGTWASPSATLGRGMSLGMCTGTPAGPTPEVAVASVISGFYSSFAVESLAGQIVLRGEGEVRPTLGGTFEGFADRSAYSTSRTG